MMKIKLALAAGALVSAIGAASAEDMTIEQYANYLVGTYGKDAILTEGLIRGRKGDQEFTDIQPELSESIRLAAAPGLQWGGPPCNPVHEKVPPTGTTTYKWYWCAIKLTVNGREYDAQRDYMKYSNGEYRYTMISQLFDCETTADKDVIRTTTTTMLARACP